MSDLAKRIDNLSPEKRALLQRHLVEKGRSASATSDSIAVVGMGCRFPFGANSPEAYWELLKNGVDAVTEVSADRWRVEDFHDPNLKMAGKSGIRWGGFLDQVDRFDYEFFGITPREASKMDPQQRLLLEVAWEALEDAGQTLKNLNGSATGVFIGIFTNDYCIMQMADRSNIDAYTVTGNTFSIAANRISYVFNLRGPSLAVDTACSSSLSAVHLACQSLRALECDLALAGGVNMLLLPLVTISLMKTGVLAADGRCKSFDARADGYVRGEGCGVVVLKRLSDALADGDHVLAIISGSAINQDGRSTGLTVPNGLAQESVIRQALRVAGLSPSQITYVETHGTGTAQGDPIEVEALKAVLGQPRNEGQFCALGSVKTNIGHLEAAAGIAGLLKVLLALKHEAIPPNLHFRELNPYISLDGTPFVIPTELLPWPSKSERRCAGLSSFGIGGVNVHLILEEAPPLALSREEPQTYANNSQSQILSISARSAGALKSLAHAYKEFLSDGGKGAEASLTDLCYSSNLRRSHHDHRLALVASKREDLLTQLASFEAGEGCAGMASGVRSSSHQHGVVFVFSGQGAQWTGMGLDLLEREPIFRESLERCDAALRRQADWSIVSELQAERPRLNETQFAQPVIFALQVSLAALWRALGVEPEAVVGHSVGEIAAAHIAGVLSLKDAVNLVWQRGRLMQGSMGKGMMVAVKLPFEEAERALAGYEGRVSIAAINSPRSVVLSGESASLLEVVQSLESKGVSCRQLEGNYAFHSQQMISFKGELVGALCGLAPQAASCGFFSTVTGSVSSGTELNADYWGRNMTEPVRFGPVVDEMLDRGFNMFIEIGPHPTLSGPISECLSRRQREGRALASMRRNQETRTTMLNSLGALYTSGYSIDWRRFYPEPQRFIRLPLYPWQRRRCWISNGEVTTNAGYQNNDRAEDSSWAHPFLRSHVPLAHPSGGHLWNIEIDKRRLSYLDDHRIQDAIVLPGAAYAEMVGTAVMEVFGDSQMILKDLEFRKALFVPEDRTQRLQLFLLPVEAGVWAFHIYSYAETTRYVGREQDQEWVLRVTGKVLVQKLSEESCYRSELDEIRKRCLESVSGADFYALMADHGNQWGPCFQGIEQFWKGDGEAIGMVRAPQALLSQMDHYQMHPALADIFGQTLAITMNFGDGFRRDRRAFMASGVTEVRYYRRLSGQQWWSHVRAHRGVEAGAEVLEGDVRIFDGMGQLVVEFLGVQFRYLEQQAPGGALQDLDNWCYEIQWQPQENSNGEDFLSDQTFSASDGWLIFADRRGVGSSLAKELGARGARLTLVSAGRAFKQIDRVNFRVRPESIEDMRRLFETLAADHELNLRFIIHLWSLDTPAEDEATLASLKSAQTLGCGSIIHLLQTLSGSAPRLWLITHGAQPINGSSDPTSIAQSTLWGLGRTIAQEHSALWGGLVDLEPNSQPEAAARALLNEILRTDGEDQLAFRQDRRYVARMVRRMRQPARTSTSFQLRADASYLITGGLGGLGLHVARWMVEQGARRLVLMGRTRLPARADWGEVEAETALAGQIEAIRALEALGASVYLPSVDVGDKAQMKAFFETFRRECWPPIRGVVHAAGLAHYQALVETKIEDLHLALRAKVLGAWLLHRLLKDAQLDFFVFFSSMSAVLNSPFLGSYAAGNAFIDALAHYRRAQNLPALSIAWGPWSESGLAARNYQKRNGQTTQQEMSSITPQKGLEALELLLKSNPPAQVGVMPINWRQWSQLYPSFTSSPLFARLLHEDVGAAGVAKANNGDSGLTRETLLATSPSEQLSLLENFVSQEVSAVMGIPKSQLDPHQPLTEMGIDSLMAIELMNRIESSLKTELKIVHFLRGPSLKKLAAVLLEQVVSASTSLPEDAPEQTTDSDWEVLRI